MTLEERLVEIEGRLLRLERLAFLAYQDVRDVAEYAYQNSAQDLEPEHVRRFSWSRRDFRPLDDREAVSVGLMAHELAALKMTMKALRIQTRRDVLSVVRDLVRAGRGGPKTLEEPREAPQAARL